MALGDISVIQAGVLGKLAGPKFSGVAGFGLPAGQCRMWRRGQTSSDDPWALYCLLGKERPKIIRGYGGAGQISRDGKLAVSSFDGRELPAYQIELRMHWRYPRPGSVDKAMRDLERLCGWNLLNDDPPPVVRFSANVAHDYSDAPQNAWQCEGLEWGESHADDSGRLLWMDATIVLGLLRSTGVPGLLPSPGFARTDLRAGENLRAFAKRVLKDARRWTDVQALNRDNSRCPRSPDFRVSKPVMLLVPPVEATPKKKAKK